LLSSKDESVENGGFDDDLHKILSTLHGKKERVLCSRIITRELYKKIRGYRRCVLLQLEWFGRLTTSVRTTTILETRYFKYVIAKQTRRHSFVLCGIGIHKRSQSRCIRTRFVGETR